MKRVHKRYPCKDCGAPTTKTWCKPCGYKNRALTPWNKGTRGLIKPNSGSFIKGMRANPAGEFKPGNIPWTKGKKGVHYSPATEFTRERTLGEKNTKWKGSSVGYFSLHSWLTRNYGQPYGQPGVCEDCGSTTKVQWASKAYDYVRDRDSWLHLCYWCHRDYDKNHGWGVASKLFNLKTGARNV